MYAQFFGNYLLSHGITKEQLMHAMQEANNEHPKLGTLAMHAGYMSASEVDRVIIMQTHEDKRFGELAIREGYLTEAQVTDVPKRWLPAVTAVTFISAKRVPVGTKNGRENRKRKI